MRPGALALLRPRSHGKPSGKEKPVGGFPKHVPSSGRTPSPHACRAPRSLPWQGLHVTPQPGGPPGGHGEATAASTDDGPTVGLEAGPRAAEPDTAQGTGPFPRFFWKGQESILPTYGARVVRGGLPRPPQQGGAPLPTGHLSPPAAAGPTKRGSRVTLTVPSASACAPPHTETGPGTRG